MSSLNPTLVADGIWRLSANAGQDILFEGLWPLPHGVSMNSFLVKGRECALIDGVCGWDGVPQTLLAQLERMGVRLQDIRYVVLNHLEPDHTGWLEPFARLHPDFTLCASARGLGMADSFYGLGQERRAVGTGDQLELGGGKVLEFHEIPNVHWPETIATWEPGTGTLFSCDAFGSFGAIGEAPYDDQLSEPELALFEEESLRYFANILAAFSSSVERALRALKALRPRIVAPAHGPVWRRDPGRIQSWYERYCAWGRGPAEPEITVIWGSMYGMTERAVASVLEGIAEEGVRAHVFRVPQSHVSPILAAAWRSTGIAVGAPVYEYRLFPPVAAVLDELARKKVVRKKVLAFGSFGWLAGGGGKELAEIVERYRLGWELLPPVEFPGAPREEAQARLREAGRGLAREVRAASADSGSTRAQPRQVSPS